MTQTEFNAQLQPVLGEGFGLPASPDGMVLLKDFAGKRPTLFLCIRLEDFINLDSETLIGISEWKALTKHVLVCPRCHEA